MHTITVLLASMLFLAACTTEPSALETRPHQSAPTEVPTTDATSDAVVTQKDVTMEVNEFAFIPSTVRIVKGTPLTITITNTGDKAHGFGLPEFNVNQRIESGETKTISFTPDKTGEFRFFCSVACGSGHSSMKGSIIVE